MPFYPVVIHESGLVIVGKSIEYNPLNDPKLERYRMVNLLEDTIKAMHLETTNNQAVGPIVFRRKIS